MNRLHATPAIMAAYSQLVTTGDLAKGVQPPPRTRAERAARARKSAAWKYQAGETYAPVDPTPQRQKKDALGMSRHTMGAGTVEQPYRAYRTKAPIDQYRGQWGDDVEPILDQFLKDAEAASITHVTVNYDAQGGGMPSRRLGGLGMVHDRQREAYARYQWIRDRLHGWRTNLAADWLLLQARDEKTGQSRGWEEFGRRVLPWVKTPAALKAAGMTSLPLLGERLQDLYRQYAQLHRGRHEPT